MHIKRGNNVPLFNDEWFDLRSTEMFVQQFLSKFDKIQVWRFSKYGVSQDASENKLV